VGVRDTYRGGATGEWKCDCGGEVTSRASRRRRDANGVSSSPLGQDSRVRSRTVRAEIFCEFLCFYL
jgi:hypothetical protein